MNAQIRSRGLRSDGPPALSCGCSSPQGARTQQADHSPTATGDLGHKSLISPQWEQCPWEALPSALALAHVGSTPGKSAPSSSRPSMLPSVTASIIAGSRDCFKKATHDAANAGLSELSWVRSEFVSINETLAACCKHGKYCGQGRRSKPAQRAHADGVMRAHRAAWRDIVWRGRPTVVLEDDATLIASRDDVAFAIARCTALRCGLAWLGMGPDFLLSHAYYIEPHAAQWLLNATRDKCNTKHTDYMLREMCFSGRERCLRPPRGLYPSFRGSTFTTQGWGLFVQDHRARKSYMPTRMGNVATRDIALKSCQQQK